MNQTITKAPHAWREMQALLKLSIPLIATGFMESSVAFFSTMFLAHLGSADLAAGAIVSWIFVTMMVILWGTLTSISIIIAQKHGAKDMQAVAYAMRDGFILATILVIPATLILWYISPILLYLGQNPETVTLAEKYMHGLIWGVLPDFYGLVLMQFMIGLGAMRSNITYTLLWVPLNIICNYVLIFGAFGFPALGIVGIGWGTTIAYWISTILMFVYLARHRTYKPYFKAMCSLKAPHFLKELMTLGMPMGLMYCIEIAFFLALTLFMGKISEEVLAANQIAMQYMGLFSVITFSLAQAITVRMGHAIGANQAQAAIKVAYVGVLSAGGFMLCIAIIYWFFPTLLIALDLDVHQSTDLAMIALAKQFFVLVGIFQIVEAVRFSFFGALRGLKDTHFTLVTSLITFWLVSFPLGYFFAIYLQWEGSGFWYGIIAGESLGVVLLYLRFQYRVKRMNQLLGSTKS